jgi:hypothetical protein
VTQVLAERLLPTSGRLPTAVWAAVVGFSVVACCLGKEPVVLLFVGIPSIVLALAECLIGRGLRAMRQPDYWRLLALTQAPLLAAAAGAGVAMVGGESAQIWSALTIAIAVGVAFVTSATIVKKSSWKALGPVGLIMLGLHAPLALLILCILPLSVTGIP